MFKKNSKLFESTRSIKDLPEIIIGFTVFKNNLEIILFLLPNKETTSETPNLTNKVEYVEFMKLPNE